ncbi:MAG: 23S rRNA (adenine(2503)-C(2))-methyltransferase RlmN [Gammaproteobacteria bacterium]
MTTSSERPEQDNLLGMPRAALEAWFTEMGEKPFHGRQVMRWMHERGIDRFDQMTDISKSLRARLTERATVSVPPVISDRTATDGTRKWLFDVGGGQAVETVYIPEPKRGTLCISSQVGCALDCSFCATGAQGFNRNLTSAEIIAQVFHATRTLHDPEASRRAVTNVVFMGMGEPLANYREVLPALNILQDDFGYALSRRRVTVSTSGLVPQIDKMAKEANVALAVSLHAPIDDLRNELVPINHRHNIESLLDACWRYAETTGAQSITFEYTMLDGVNDSVEHATKLASLLRHRPAKVNLIPFNPFPSTRYQRSDDAVIKRFHDTLHRRGIRTMVRRTRGDDIDAACGQLAGQVADRTRVRLGSRQFALVQEAS